MTSKAVQSLLGLWRLVSFDIEFQDSGRKILPFGPQPQGRLILLPNSVMMVVITSTDRPIPISDDERVAAFNNTIAYSGRYTVDGDLLKVNVDISWNEAWRNTVQLRTIKLTDAGLSLISDWAPSPAAPEKIVRGTLDWVRED
jgi:hypothetical protein